MATTTKTMTMANWLPSLNSIGIRQGLSLTWHPFIFRIETVDGQLVQTDRLLVDDQLGAVGWNDFRQALAVTGNSLLLFWN